MGRIWAIARHTIAEGIRMKIALVFIAFLLMILGGLPFFLRREDSVASAIQTFLSFSLGGTGMTLSLLTIFLSRSLSDELVNHQILLLMTKPIPRWQYLVGKWTGIVTLNFGLLLGAGISIYGAVRVMANLPPRDELDRVRVTDEILTARHATDCEIPDFTGLANRTYEQKLERGEYVDVIGLDPATEKERLRKNLEIYWRTIGPAESRVFEFKNIRCKRSSETTLQIRYKPEVYSYAPDEVLRCIWVIGNPEKGTAIYERPRRDVIGRYHTLSVPTDAVASDRTLTAQLININPFEGEPQYQNVVSFQGGDNVQVLFRVGTFGGNLVRLLALQMCKLMFLAAFALMTACVFSFPVACLVTLTFLAMASLAAFLTDAVTFFDSEGVYGLFRSVTQVLYQIVFFIIPDFSRYDGTSMLVDGRNVTLMWVLTGIRDLVVVGTTSLMLVACLLFQRREVSEVSI
ncbi:MAG: ABC transporter permease [Planctomycetes bacterium]|nr:ABC transporter permease [Planctomycetota bacterium]